ncbi:DUF1900-domain-containing protein [Backusella circina FSU 941]|nr:DUF1900-domain-containing protein [Backusella circina FSU 941]
MRPESAVLIKQGAEARVFHVPSFLNLPNGCIAKERFKKTYRHPDLDQQLTHKRVVQEARSLVRCKKGDIDTPTLYFIDSPEATIYMENVIGITVKQRLLDNQETVYKDIDLGSLAEKIGSSLGKMHALDIIHGDLTTSNLMLREENDSVVLIDFGLSFGSRLAEDKAVDLYVLERAFSSTHPNTEQLAIQGSSSKTRTRRMSIDDCHSENERTKYRNMSKRFQNLNKYRNVVGKVAKKEEWYPDVQVGSSSSDASSLIRVNHKYIAIKWAGNGGAMGLLPLDKPGKGCSSTARVFHAHGASVSDWDFSEFNDSLLATGAEDSMVKLWKIPEEEGEPSCITTLTTPSRRVDIVRFHPTTDQIMSTLGNDGKKVCIWDVEKSVNALNVTGKTPFHSFSWKSNGSLLVTSGKGAVDVWDPRAEQPSLSSGTGHEGIKGSRVIWLGNSNHIFTVGTNKMRNRQYALWDSRNMDKPLKMNSLDSSTGMLLPMYDEDTETIYMISRGDATVHSLQISDVYTNPTIAPNMACGSNATIYGAALLPKHSLDVMHTEIARLMAVTENSVIPISYQVPRKSYLDFHFDLYPDTKGTESPLTGKEWLEGKTVDVSRVSLDPKRVAYFEKNAVQQSNSPQTNSSPLPEQKVSETPKPEKETAATSPTSPISTTTTAAATTTANTTAAETVTSTPTPQLSSSNDSNEITKQSSSSTSIKSTSSTHTNKSDEKKVNNDTTSPKQEEPVKETVVPPVKKVLPKFGAANASVYKYISGKIYHPRTHYEDLRGLSIDKSGTCDLIQASGKLIAVPISGPGGRIGIIDINKPGRLPTHVPCVLCGSEVSSFKFDPFNPLRLLTVSVDNKIRVWDIPEGGIEEDMAEPTAILDDKVMDKVHLLEFHPTSKDIVASVSEDIGNPTIRIWNVETKTVEIELKGTSKDVIFGCAWSPDGTKFAISSRDKKVRVLDARTGDVVAVGASHESLRPSRLLWLDNDLGLIASVGFGRGSAREILLLKIDDLSKPLAKKMIDVSPSVMSAYYDIDCKILFVAGRGDRTIHTFELEDYSKFTPLAKIEAGSLQQGFAFMPKMDCNVKDIEIDKFYRLTPTNIEPVGVRVPRARPEYFQDDIFIPTLDILNPSQSASSWFSGKDQQLSRISLKPDDMELLSTAPPPASQAQSKAKFEMGKQFVSDEQRKQEIMDRMFKNAKDVEAEVDDTPKVKPEDQEVADDEWDD